VHFMPFELSAVLCTVALRLHFTVIVLHCKLHCV
jgi:hypothetical protein